MQHAIFTAPKEKDGEAGPTCAMIDKLAKRNIIHKNKANNLNQEWLVI